MARRIAIGVLGPPRKSTIARLVSSVLSTSVANIVTLEQGGDSDVFCVSTNTKELVVKAQWFNYVHVYRKAEWAASIAQKRGVPVPTVHYIGRRKLRSFMVEDCVGSSDPTRTKSIDVWSLLGEYSRAINSIAVTGFGKNFGLDWEAYVEAAAHTVFGNNVLESRRVLSPAELDKAQSVVRQLRSWSPKPRLHHGDISPDNVIVDSDGKTTLIDWTDAIGQVAEYTLADLRHMAPNRNVYKAFAKGYGVKEAELVGFLGRIRPLTLLCVLQRVFWRAQKGATNTEEYDRLVRGLQEELDLSK